MSRKPRLTLAERQQAIVMNAAGHSGYAIAKTLNRDAKAVNRILREPGIVEQVEEKRAELCDMFEDVARRMVSSITDECITDLNAYQRMVASGIAVDKSRLLKGQSTHNLAHLFSLAEID